MVPRALQRVVIADRNGKVTTVRRRLRPAAAAHPVPALPPVTAMPVAPAARLSPVDRIRSACQNASLRGDAYSALLETVDEESLEHVADLLGQRTPSPALLETIHLMRESMNGDGFADWSHCASRNYYRLQRRLAASGLTSGPTSDMPAMWVVNGADRYHVHRPSAGQEDALLTVTAALYAHGGYPGLLSKGRRYVTPRAITLSLTSPTLLRHLLERPQDADACAGIIDSRPALREAELLYLLTEKDAVLPVLGGAL